MTTFNVKLRDLSLILVAAALLCAPRPGNAQQEAPPPGPADQTPDTEAPDQMPAPAPADQAPTPGSADQAPAPATEDQTPAPAAEDQTPAPATEDQAPTPTLTQSQPLEARPPRVILGLGLGVFIPTSALSPNVLVGIDGAFQLPWLQRKLGVGLGLAFSMPSTSGTITDDRLPGDSAAYESTMQEFMLDLDISYRFFSWASRWSPHAGIGPVFYFLSHNVTSLEVEHTETSTQVGFLLRLGADYRLRWGALIGEVRIPFAAVGQRTTGDSNVGAVSMVVGYRFRL